MASIPSKSSTPYVGQFVGVVPPSAFETLWYPKQLLLMFDCLAIDLGQKGLKREERAILQRSMPEIQWLVESEMLTILSGLMASKSLTPTEAEMNHARSTLASSSVSFERLNAAILRKKGIDAVPLTTTNEESDVDSVADRDAVVRLTLCEFPAPSDTTPWESIEDFRRDKDARNKFWDLKRWINKAGKSGLTQYEVADELMGLMNDYTKHFTLHKMKAQVSVLEVLVTTTAEIAENLVKVKWSKAAKSLFKVGKQNIALFEDEKDIPGKEVAYIADAWKRFYK